MTRLLLSLSTRPVLLHHHAAGAQPLHPCIGLTLRGQCTGPFGMDYVPLPCFPTPSLHPTTKAINETAWRQYNQHKLCHHVTPKGDSAVAAAIHICHETFACTAAHLQLAHDRPTITLYPPHHASHVPCRGQQVLQAANRKDRVPCGPILAAFPPASKARPACNEAFTHVR
jgi:hypothetical protein